MCRCVGVCRVNARLCVESGVLVCEAVVGAVAVVVHLEVPKQAAQIGLLIEVLGLMPPVHNLLLPLAPLPLLLIHLLVLLLHVLLFAQSRLESGLKIASPVLLLPVLPLPLRLSCRRGLLLCLLSEVLLVDLRHQIQQHSSSHLPETISCISLCVYGID